MPYSQMAEHVRSKGRGHDTMLVHMTPGEVSSLQGLARATGGSLTTNPHTGLPEAGWLGKLLPMIAGIGLNFILPGSGGLVGALGGKAITAGLITGLGTGIATGNVGQGLMGALGGFGGASLGAGLQGAFGAGATSATTGAANAATAAAAPVAEGTLAGLANAAPVATTLTAGSTLPTVATTLAGTTLPSAAFAPGAGLAAVPTAAAAVPIAAAAPDAALAMIPPKTGLAGFAQGFGNAAKGLDSTGLGSANILGKYAPMAAGAGILGSLYPSVPKPGDTSQKTEYGYTGPYRYKDVRSPTYGADTQTSIGGTAKNYYSTPEIVDSMGNPYTAGQKTTPFATSSSPTGFSSLLAAGTMKQPGESQADYLMRAQQQGFTPQYAAGGKMPIQDGSFIVDARTVAELGNGSSGAGQDMLSRMGGMPIRGPGDGVSDSIHARIGGNQEARVARDEVKFGPEAVTRLGKGSHSRGTQKLYSLMDKAAKARKSAKRGQDTGLRRGLA